MNSKNNKLELKYKKRMLNLEYEKAKAEVRNAKKKVSYSKLLTTFIFIVVIEVIAFSEFEMHRLSDLTALYVLIGATVTVGFGAAIQMLWKSAKENTKGGIVYDVAMCEAMKNNETEMNQDKEKCNEGDILD